nr:hypothetical protein [Tanacetum cinerariifolium]
VKAIDRVSPIKSKLKVTDKSNSPKSRWLPMSERFLSPQPVTQYNLITGEVRNESEKAVVVKGNFVVSKSKVGKSKVAAVGSEKLTVVKESVVKSIEKSTVAKESDVTSKVSDESNKAAVVAPVIEKVLVSVKETEPVVVVDVKAESHEIQSESHEIHSESYVIHSESHASNTLKNKPAGKGKKPVVVVDKASNTLKNKPAGKGKKPVVGTSKKDVYDSELETDVVDYSSNEADRK